MNVEFQVPKAMLSQQWERTKGELRATVALQVTMKLTLILQEIM